MGCSEIQLKRLYNRFNTEYFNGELPDVIIFYSPVSAYADCDYVDGVFTIRVNPVVASWTGVLKLTLLHEMIHVKIHPVKSHGVKFDREVQRLMQFKSVRSLI